MASKRRVSLKLERWPMHAPFRITGHVFTALDCVCGFAAALSAKAGDVNRCEHGNDEELCERCLLPEESP